MASIQTTGPAYFWIFTAQRMGSSLIQRLLLSQVRHFL